ncbi:MAG TPA: oligosaccharide flippase family protein [Candidatus Saccharimonadales bacterium]|nr:oligosaccharide flippase family protein [Candidatus Saccharimonadales bacterium]
MDELDLLTLGKQSIRGVLALISQTFVLQLISTGALVIVLTILTPADVGVFVAVTALRRIIDFFTDFGFGAALVQKKDELTQDDIGTTFTIQAGITFSIFLLSLLLQKQVGSFMKLNNQGIRLFLALVFSVFLSSFKTIPSILLERKIQFQKLVIPQVAESLVYNILLVILVLKGFRVDSYVYAFLAAGFVGIPFYYYVSPWKITFGINRKALHNLKFGAQFQAKNILATIKDDLLTVILAKFLTFTEIGYIGFAQRIAFLPYRYVVDSVTKVTFSAYSRIQENTQVLKKAIEKSLFFVSAIMFPLLAGIILIIPYFIHYFPKWHNKWEPAIISLVFFCINAAVSSMSGLLINVLDATGRVKKTLFLMIIWTILTWTLTPLFIYLFGYNGVAASSAIVTLTIGYSVYLVRKIVYFDFGNIILKPIVSTTIMGLAVYGYMSFFVKDLITLGVGIVIGGLVYFSSFYLLAKEELHSVINFVLKKHE